MTARCLLILVILLAAALAPAPSHANPTSASGDLLVFDEALRELTPLEPETLAPMKNAAIAFGPEVSSWSFARSADGSTLISLDPADPRAFTVRDGRTGTELRRVETELTIMDPLLSADGSRLLVHRDWSDALSWALYDVETGALISTFACPEGWAQPEAVSPDLSRLYYLTIPSNNPLPSGERALHPELVTVDLHAGEVIGRTLLPEIASGILDPDQPASDDALYQMNIPGMAVSPDGSTIAVVRADRAGFTLIDAATLQIEREETITRPQGAVNRLLTWLSILPRSAGAKMGLTDAVYAAFNPTGDRLYVWGTHTAPELDEQREISSGTGLIAVDLSSGAIVAEGPEGQLIVRLASDRDALYVTGPSSGQELRSWVDPADIDELRSTHYLQRLNPQTLRVQSAVEYPSPIWLTVTRTED